MRALTGLRQAPTEAHDLPAAEEAPGLPRLLAGVPARGAMTLSEHLAIHGELAPQAGDPRGASPLIGELDRAGLRGRGGAGFPTAAKLRAVASARGRAIVLANGAEGEPASLKDRTLLELAPHLVLDGGLLAAQAVGAQEVIVCVCEAASAGADSVAQALRERRSGADAPGMRLTVVPGHYVGGQEAALVNHLNGGPAIPTFAPPLPFERGVRRRPTLVNNVETLAHVALIARHGARWFRQLGTPSQPGSTLVTLSGPVAHPGVYEIEQGTSLASLIDAAGGTTAGLRGALVGGYAGTWIGTEPLSRLSLSDEHLTPHGASLGAGVVTLLSENSCPVAETARVARWLADQSAGQCGPCVHGLDAIATSVEELARGTTAQAQPTQRIARLAALVRRRGACGHPDGAANFVLSALQAFAAELSDHARHGPCEACAGAGELPLPVHPRTLSAHREAAAIA
jgi:NADH:ubiquinone oxidoreductase subunit F (NADH-binding)